MQSVVFLYNNINFIFYYFVIQNYYFTFKKTASDSIFFKNYITNWTLSILICIFYSMVFAYTSERSEISVFSISSTLKLFSIVTRRKYWIPEYFQIRNRLRIDYELLVRFLTSGFRWNYTVWKVRNTIWLVLENVRL